MEILSLSNYVYNPHAIPPLITGLAILLLGIFVLSKNIRDLKHIVFFIFTVNIAIWQISSFFFHSAVSNDIAYWWGRYILFLGLSFIHIHPYYFSVLIFNLKNQRKFVILGYIIGAIFCIMQVSTGYVFSDMKRVYWGHSAVLGPLGAYYLIFFYIYATALLLNFYLGYRRAVTDAERLKLKYLFMGLLVATTGSSDFIAMSGYELYQFGYFFVDALAVIMAYTIVRHRLLDIETVAHKTLLWLTSSITIIVSIGLLAITLRVWLQTLTTLQQIIFYSVMFFGLLSFYNWLQPKLDHFFQRKKYGAEAVFIRFIKDISLIKGVEDLADKIINTLAEVFYADTFIILFDEDYKKCMLTKGIGSSIIKNKNYLPDAVLLKWLRDYDDVIEVEQIQIDPEHADIKDKAMIYFDSLNAKICIPLVFYGRLLGLIILGKKGSLSPFTISDIKLLSMFRIEAAVALSNSLSYTDLQMLKGELENKVRERTDELAKAYIELKKEHEKTKEVARLKSLFIANVSHELRTPLSSIIGFSELLGNKDFGELTDKQDKYLNTIQKSSKHLLHLINNVLDLSKVDAGKMPVTVSEFSISDLLRDAVEEFLPIVSKKEIKLITEFKDKLPEIAADSVKLKEVIDNLLSNAVKFTPMGGTVKVKARLIQPSALRSKASKENDFNYKDDLNYIYVSVEDSGIGIKKEDIDRIFDAFEQVDNSYTKQYQGTGLGLAIVKKYIELHKGRIWVESELGNGSRFSFIIPERIISDIALKKTSFDLYKMLHGIIYMMSSETEAKKVKIDFRCEWSFGYKITADKELLRGILINIINNAVRYSPMDGSVIVELKSIGRRYIISIGNKGDNEYGGMTYSFFTPKGDYDISPKICVGLSDAKTIIEAHGGSISVKNDTEDKITWLEISIPE